MKREDFIKIIRIRSCWKVDRRIGNYKLPSGERLSVYIRTLVKSQLKLDSLVIKENGNLEHGSYGKWDAEKKCYTDYVAYIPFNGDEICSYDEQERRISSLIAEIVG